MATLIIDGSGTGGTEPRRRFSDDDKARIVSEAFMTVPRFLIQPEGEHPAFILRR